MASIALPTLASPSMATSLRLSVTSLLNPKSRSSPHLSRRISARDRTFAPLSSQNFCLAAKQARFLHVLDGRPLGFAVRSAPGETPAADAPDDADKVRPKSTMPERFRHLTKEVPDSPVRWPWLIALPFLIYAWRTVLWELTNWKKTLFAITRFLGYLCKLVLAFLFHYIGDPITQLIRCIEYTLYFIRDVYGSIVAFTPVTEITRIILFTSIVLAIAEATVPDAVNSQPYVLTLAGTIAFGAVMNFLPELIFWFLLSGLFCYSRFIKKRDSVSSALPSAAVLVAVGEPWVRILVIGLYLTLAIYQYSKFSTEVVERDVPEKVRRLPVPLLLSGLAIGVHLAAKWVRYRHLTWMVA